MDLIFIILICCILTSSLSSSIIIYYWNDEVQKLQSLGKTAADNCKNNNNLLFKLDNKNLCPYGRNACADFKNAKYSEWYCPLNYNFVIDVPKGTRDKIINSIFQFNANSDDIFNSAYFIKKDVRRTVFLFCNKNINSIQDMYPTINLDSIDKPNNNKFINIKSGDLIKISKSTEVDSFGIKYDSYYIYIIYDLIITLPISIGLGVGKGGTNEGQPIIINSLLDLKKAFAKMERSFQVSLNDEELIVKKEEAKPIYVTSGSTSKTVVDGVEHKDVTSTTRQVNVGATIDVTEVKYITTTCDNVPLRIRQPKNKKDTNDGQKYSTLCFFYEKNDIGSIISLLHDILFKIIDKSILNEYFTELQTKINNNNTIIIFEYIMYIGLINYLREDSKYKFVVNILS
jgi:hypothetical protein